MGEAQDYQNTLEEAYHTHWQNKVLLHPDAERAKRLLAQGKFPNYEIFAVKSSWSNTQRKSRMKPPRISMNCRGNVFWMMCLQTTWKRDGDVAAASGHRRTVSENRRRNC